MGHGGWPGYRVLRSLDFPFGFAQGFGKSGCVRQAQHFGVRARTPRKRLNFAKAGSVSEPLL
jgi:hypothetical protein